MKPKYIIFTATAQGELNQVRLVLTKKSVARWLIDVSEKTHIDCLPLSPAFPLTDQEAFDAKKLWPED